MHKNLEKEVDDIVRPVETSGKTPWKAIVITSITTGLVAFAILYFSGYLGQPPDERPNTNSSPNCVTAQEAKSFVGKTITVCGTVTSTNFAVRTRRRPTFINLDQPYPNQIFTIVIWGNDRSKFGAPELDYRNMDISVSGVVEMYRGKPQIVVTEPAQIKVR